MRISTPRATPVAPALRAAPEGAQPREEPLPLAGPTLIVWRGGDYPLTDGAVSIGRSHECEVRLDDPLVSRLHARVRLDADRVGIEDLHSTNGVYVRGERIAHFASLRDGERVMLGTHELSFHAYSEEREPESGVGHKSSGAPDAGSASVVAEARPTLPTTARAAALEMVGSLGRRFAREGRADEGASVLIPHLQRILRGANSGLELSPELCGQAAAYAMDVAVWTADAAWLDYIVQLHVATKSLMPHSTILALKRRERWLGAIDRPLLQYYIEICAARSSSFTGDEQLRLRLLERLLVAKF